MNRINFSHNWNNKLDCEFFTTIRRATSKKEDYYKRLIGKPFISTLNDVEHSFCELINVETEIGRFLPVSCVCVDVGKPYEEAVEVLKKFGAWGNVLVLTFRNIKRVSNAEKQTTQTIIKLTDESLSGGK